MPTSTQQSPIEINPKTAIPVHFPEGHLDVDYAEAGAVTGTFDNDNFAVDASYGLYTHFGGDTYRLAKIHFHVHREHLIKGGDPASMELHFVHVRLDDHGNFGIGTTSPGTYGKLAVNGAIAPIGTAGTYSIDVSAAAVSVANNGTVAFPSSSGMLVVNNHSNGGLTIYICGGGSTAAVASVIGAVGTFAYSVGNSGYTWTNNTGATVTVGFFFVRTRTTA
jgi:hypothetical protein